MSICRHYAYEHVLLDDASLLRFIIMRDRKLESISFTVKEIVEDASSDNIQLFFS